MSTWARIVYQRKYICNWIEQDDMITVKVGIECISKEDLQKWLHDNGRRNVDFKTKFRANLKYTYIEFYNESLAFLFKMSFINPETYRDLTVDK